MLPPARAASSASIARPALSTWLTARRSKRLAPAIDASACGHNVATTARCRAPLNTSASPSRRTLAPANACSVGVGIGLQLAGADVGGDLRDGLARQRRIELAAEGLHERHAFDH